MIYTWDDAEAFCAQYLRRTGYPEARVTNPGSDGGIDIIGSGIVGQVKFHQAKSPRSDLQRLVGAVAVIEHRRLVFFASGGFAQPAIDYAYCMGMELVEFNHAGQFRCITGGLPDLRFYEPGSAPKPRRIPTSRYSLKPVSAVTPPQTKPDWKLLEDYFGAVLLLALVVCFLAYMVLH